ncbi:MAG: alpha/beta hydrolase [Lapillicoccus sp.]
MTGPAYYPRRVGVGSRPKHAAAGGPVPPVRPRRADRVYRPRFRPPLLISTCWLSHLQYDWESPVWRHFLADLGRFATVIRFDERGYGLSDGDVTDFSLEMRVADLESVADDAGFPRFALMAMAQGGPVAIRYAAAHPERVTRLPCYNSYADAQRDLTPKRPRSKRPSTR